MDINTLPNIILIPLYSAVSSMEKVGRRVLKNVKHIICTKHLSYPLQTGVLGQDGMGLNFSLATSKLCEFGEVNLTLSYFNNIISEMGAVTVTLPHWVYIEVKMYIKV